MKAPILMALAGLALGCATTAPAERSTFAHAPLARTPDAVQARFVPGDRHAWDLLDDEGRLLCALPCIAWLPRQTSGLALTASDEPKEKPIAVPDDLHSPAGEPV